jgi:RimJ/RimL family protein N-acetyltransferase
MSTNAYAGSTSFGNYDPKNERIEIGWTWLFSNYQRTGLNWNMKYLMFQFAFEELNIKRVELKADGRNLQSRNAMQGIGAQYEGTLRSHTIMSDGYRRDTVYYSVLADEWPAVSSRLLTRINK